ncbi:cobalamin biosynthesis protein, partial [Acinetobacter baumannii]
DRLGEPPAWAHPVVGMGCYLGLFRLTQLAPAAGFIAGALAWLVGAAAVVSAAMAVEIGLWTALKPWASPGRLAAAALLLGLLLKPLLAWRMLADEVMAVDAALANSL